MRYKIFAFPASPKPLRKVLTPEELKEGGGFLPTPEWKNSFQLYNKGPWRDLTAAAIRRAEQNETSDYSMPDIACFQEVESIEALRLFNERYLNNYYKYQLVIDSFDPRRIDVGVLSNFKMQSIVTHMFERVSKQNKGYIFSRDCLEISFEITKNKNLTLFINHLKSKFISPFTPKNKVDQEIKKANSLRLLQAIRVKEIVSKRFKADRFETENFVVLGDFNDTPVSKFLLPLTVSSRMQNAISRLDPKEMWTHWWDSKNIVSQLDYILLSPKLDLSSSGKPYIERRGISNRIKKFSYLNEKREENKIKWDFKRFNDVSDKYEASDHCPVFLDLTI
jgi:endonuclease/exonuclease/phosphatase family metal-dependent hydrolase